MCIYKHINKLGTTFEIHQRTVKHNPPCATTTYVVHWRSAHMAAPAFLYTHTYQDAFDYVHLYP
jgi:hypothetical protein